jgi:hypothetical protein
MHVSQYDVQPEGAEKMIRVQGPENGIYKYGDAVSWITSSRFSMRVEKLTLAWRFADEPESELNRFIIPL